MTYLISITDVIEEISKGVWNVYELIDRIKALPSADTVKAVQDCRNCKYGSYNDHLETWFCNHNCECSNWDMWESADAVQGEWIPCSERLPIPPTFCLVTTDGSYGDVIDIALYMSDGWHKASEVIAWMPLPTPYKGGDTE